MSNEVFEKWFAELLAKANSGDSTAQAALEFVKASQSVDAFKEMSEKATSYDAKHFAREREKKAWMAEHGQVVLDGLVVLEKQRHALELKMKDIKYQFKSNKDSITELKKIHGAVVYREDGQTRVRRAGASSGTTRTKGAPKVWLDTKENTFVSYAAAAESLGLFVGKASAHKVLTDKGHDCGLIQ